MMNQCRLTGVAAVKDVAVQDQTLFMPPPLLFATAAAGI